MRMQFNIILYLSFSHSLFHPYYLHFENAHATCLRSLPPLATIRTVYINIIDDDVLVLPCISLQSMAWKIFDRFVCTIRVFPFSACHLRNCTVVTFIHIYGHICKQWYYIVLCIESTMFEWCVHRFTFGNRRRLFLLWRLNALHTL